MQKYKIVVIVGPNHDYYYVDDLKKTLTESGFTSALIVNDTFSLNKELLNQYLKDKIDRDTSIHILAHGFTIRYDKDNYDPHSINIYQNSLTPTTEFLWDLKTIFYSDAQNQNDDMFVDIWSCHCGILKNNAPSNIILTLHGGQKYTTIVPMSVEGIKRAVNFRKENPGAINAYVSFLNHLSHSPETITFVKNHSSFSARAPKFLGNSMVSDLYDLYDFAFNTNSEVSNHINEQINNFVEFLQVSLGFDKNGDAALENYISDISQNRQIAKRYIELAFIMECGRKDSNNAIKYIDKYLKYKIVNTTLDDGFSALHSATISGDKNVIKILLDNGANVNAITEHSVSPLYLCCSKGDIETTQILLDNGADIETKTIDNSTAFFVSCQKGHEEIAKILIDKGADINTEIKCGITPLFKACQNCHDKVVQLLLNNNANFDKQTINGSTPLYTSCQLGHQGIVALLLEKGANINKGLYNEFTPLMVAVLAQKEEIVKLLLNKIDNIADITKKVNGENAENFAKENNSKIDDSHRDFFNKSATEITTNEKIKNLISERIADLSRTQTTTTKIKHKEIAQLAANIAANKSLRD